MVGEFLEFPGVSFSFLFFNFQPLKAWHSFHLGTEHDRRRHNQSHKTTMSIKLFFFRNNVSETQVQLFYSILVFMGRQGGGDTFCLIIYLILDLSAYSKRVS